VKHINRRLAAIAAGLCLTIGVAGCSSVDTTPSQVALHYQNGAFSSRTYKSFVPPGSLEYHKISDDYYYYPNGQRTIHFAAQNGDAPPLVVTSSDGQPMTIEAFVTFHLDTNPGPYNQVDPATNKVIKTWDGGRLQEFHERIAFQEGAYASGSGDEPGPGWDRALAKSLVAPIQRSLNLEALKYPWRALYSDAQTKSKWEADALAQIPDLIKQANGGEDYFGIDGIIIPHAPVPPQQLLAGIVDNQTAHLRADTTATDQQAAANFPGGVAAYGQFLQQQAITKAINDGKIQIMPVPLGSPVIVGGK
jgi:hypothetical protein